jgi:hypothetical protein
VFHCLRLRTWLYNEDLLRQEAQFVKALKEKKWMGLENTRPLMPPMSMMPATEMSKNELKAIFAYLKTTTPIKNVQPAAELLPPPVAGTK